jgi:predicted enzyme related to lactoylglutathione lyase
MPILGLRTAIYKVSDINEAKDWYSKAFNTTPYFDQPFYVGFSIGGYELGLQPEEVTPQKGESVAAYWGVEDVQKEYDRLIGLGATENEPPQNVGDDIIVATLKDPWNNVLGLIYNPHFKL